MISIAHIDPVAHLLVINAKLREMGLKLHVQVHPINSNVTYRIEIIGDPDSPAWVVHCIYKRGPSSERLLQDLFDLFHAIAPGREPQGMIRNDQWLFYGTGSLLFVLALDQGIGYEKAAWLNELPPHLEIT